jgi:hypothetical protein
MLAYDYEGIERPRCPFLHTVHFSLETKASVVTVLEMMATTFTTPQHLQAGSK